MANDEQQRMRKALERAKQPKRPAGLDGGMPERMEPPAEPDDGWTRPERVEHTSEKEHPPGKE
jgi:hypothetical protein